MSKEAFSTLHVDYLQRTRVDAVQLALNEPSTSAPPANRRLWRVLSLGRTDESSKRTPERGGEGSFTSPSADVLIGLYGLRIPVAFLVSGEGGRTSIRVGTWSPNRENFPSDALADLLEMRQNILSAAFTSQYPAIELEPDTDVVQEKQRHAGLVLGFPTAKPPDSRDGGLSIDRLIRAMSGSTWAALVLAEPVNESGIVDLRNTTIKEMRTVQAAAQAEKAPSPLAKSYLRLLSEALKTQMRGLEAGLWRTGVYLIGDNEGYSRLEGIWRGIFSGNKSLPEPVHVLKSDPISALAANWSLPDASGLQGPGDYQHPARYQTLLTSSQLATYIHLPQLETMGFAICTVPDFDIVQQAKRKGTASIQVGHIVARGKPSEVGYDVDLDALTKHVFVAGVTGAGKTTTISHLLRQAWQARIPFLVVEPTKTEYRELRKYPEFANTLHVFTLGDENCSPIRINPFELVDDNTPISLHIDLLRSVFTHSFGLWNPLPQILEECLYLIYQDKGWDIAGNFNRRTKNRTDPNSFPTLTDLTNKIATVTQHLQWDPEAKSRIQGALRDKLKGLGHGGRGRMLDVQRSIPMIELMEYPTVLELERLGDDDDKAFVMGLLFIRLWEYRQAQPKPADGERKLRHLLVFEEAHRLLTNVSPAHQQGETDAKAKAVESFTNLLSEIRAYGQGMIVTDQVPTKLAPDVIKNTNLKIAHRIVDSKDREVVAGSMAMMDHQNMALAILEQGRAAIFMEGEDRPLLVKIPSPTDEHTVLEKPLEQHMSAFRKRYKDFFLRHPGCKDTAEHGGSACEAARALVETESFRRNLNRLLLSVIADDSAGDRLWPSIDQSLNSFLPQQVNRETMLQCVISRAAMFYALRRGSQAQWSYENTNDFAQLLGKYLSDLANGRPAKDSLDRLRECYSRLSVMNVPYYSRCYKICDSQPSQCLYRHAVADVVEGGNFTNMWNGSDPRDPTGPAGTKAVCISVGNTLLENHVNQTIPFRRASLCYGQMMLAKSNVLPESGDQLVDLLCEQYQLAKQT